MTLRRLGFLTLGLFDPDDPGAGHESTLRLIELGERLGLDSAWLRHRHLQHGISSPLAVIAAASQRTSRIDLGTAVTPLGWENPLRLAEDLATVDVLTGGRLHPGVSAGPPAHWDEVSPYLYPDTAEQEVLDHQRAARLAAFVSGGRASDFTGTQGIETFVDRVEPHSPGLRQRLWYGAGSLRSATWAGEHGFNLLTSSVVMAGDTTDFETEQAAQIQAYRAQAPTGRVSQGLVVIPTDSADAGQRAKYEAYAASRLPRTTSPQGPRGMMFAPDLVGPSAEVAERLEAHAGYRLVDEVAFALPFTFEQQDYEQILHDLAHALGPALGWSPTGGVEPVSE